MKVTAILAVLVAVLIGCAPPVSRYQTLLDGLPIPATWERTTERIQAPGTSTTCATILPHCPMVTRYFVVPGTPADAYTQA